MPFLQAASSTSDLTAYTFSSQNLGTPDAKRHILVCAGCRGTNSGLVLSTLTVGGVAASIIAQVTNSTNLYNCAAQAVVALPSGTTGDVVVTWNVGVLRCSIQMYELLLDSATPHDTLTNSGGLSTDPTGTIDIPDGGTAIGGSNTSNATTCTWTGVGEDSDVQTETWTASSASSSAMSPETGRTITADWASASNAVLVASSWAAPSAGGTVLTADAGSYAITGTNASLEQGYEVQADTGSFSISGVAANLNQGYEVAAVPGEYLVSGVDANFLLGFGFSADSGSYSITGTTTTLLVANLLNAEVGSYLVSGVAANLEQGYLLQVGDSTSGSSFGTGSNDSAVGTHAWMGPENVDMDDGVSATASTAFSVLNTQYLKVLDFSTLSIPPDASIVGLTVTVDRDPPGGANPTEFLKIVKGGIVVGNEISGVMGSGVATLGDSESLSGFGVSLLPSDIDENFGVVYRVTAGSAINSVGVDYIQVTIYYRDNAGVYSVTGTDPNFIEGFGLSADVGSYLITGVSANLLQHSVLNAAVGSYVITGVAANLAENLENIVGGRFVAGQVYYPGFVNAEIFYPGFKQAQVNN